MHHDDVKGGEGLMRVVCGSYANAVRGMAYVRSDVPNALTGMRGRGASAGVRACGGAGVCARTEACS